MATRQKHLSSLLERFSEQIAETLASAASEVLGLDGDDPGAVARAARMARAAHQLAPRSRETLLTLARAASLEGDHRTAADALRALLKSRPRDAEALHELGMLQEEQGDSHAARGCYRRAIRLLDPADPAAALPYLSLAELELDRGARARAAQHARAGLRRLRRTGADVTVLVNFLERVNRTP